MVPPPDKTPEIKDEDEAFHNFVTKNLNKEGMLYTQYYDESKDEWRKNFKLPNDYIIA